MTGDTAVTPKPVRPRRGAALVETAIVLVVLVLLICGTITGGFGVFRHQQVTCLASEGARWASVRGTVYETDSALTAPTRQQIVDQAILPRAVGIGASELDVKVEWIDRGTNTAYDWDASPKTLRSVAPSGEYVTNAVRVTVTYRWSAAILWGTTELRGVCERPMSN